MDILRKYGFFIVAIAFMLIAVVQTSNDQSGAVFIALGAVFLAIGAGNAARARKSKGDE